MRQRNLHVDVDLLFTSPTLAALAGATERIQEIRL